MIGLMCPKEECPMELTQERIENAAQNTDVLLSMLLIVEWLAMNHFHHACDDGGVCFAAHLKAERNVARHFAVHVDKTFCDSQVFCEERVDLSRELLLFAVWVHHLEGEDGVGERSCHVEKVSVADGFLWMLEDDIDVDCGRFEGINLLEGCGNGVAVVQLGYVHDDDGATGVCWRCQHHVIEDVRRGETFDALRNRIEHI